tara:strand:- start:5320 stop:5844 length:525 start_codon:yes stop_codon:yes gene_type:complete
MYYLNRLRGTKSIWAKYNAIILGIIFGLSTQNYYIGVAVAVGYLAGESMGWGEWIGGLMRRIADSPTMTNPRRDGDYNGIQWIAEKFSKIDTDDYFVTSLFLRGLWWWTLTFVSLYWVLDPLLVTITILFLASWFPLSILMAESNDLQWENAEYIYGGAQDIGIGVLLIGILIL